MWRKNIQLAISQVNKIDMMTKKINDYDNLLDDSDEAFNKESNSWLDKWDPKKKS